MARFAPRPDRRLLSVLVIAGLLAILASGCRGRLGPASVRMTRTDYNVAAQETSAQELLLNLVRLRYRDTPYFLQIASLSTNMKATAGLTGQGSFLTPGADAGLLTGSVAIEESPTVTYTPIVGDRFVSELLEPVEPGILLLLSHAGWSIDRFFRLLVQEANGVANAPTASGPTPDLEPVYTDFLRASELLRVLQSRRQIALIRGALDATGRELATNAGASAKSGVLLRLTPDALGTSEHRELASLLGLDPSRTLFELVQGIGAHSPHRINLVLRSVLSAMFYASHGIAVPDEDREAGRVTTTRTTAGEPFDWHRLTGTLLRVETGRPPIRPYTAVRYRGHLFWIDDADRESKSTFSMLDLVIALKSGDVPTTGPILTLPVAK
ncbi:MAG: hypothetical protein H6748_15720 [Spirochaetaceae bacterium]|nr:hypothetical protein [Spirochaetaceae bacterium]HPG24389.1 hypothetical protein [Myxococcota bacterium]